MCLTCPLPQAEEAEPTPTAARASKPAPTKKSTTTSSPVPLLTTAAAAALPTQTTRESRAVLRKSLTQEVPLPASEPHHDTSSAPNVVAPKRRRSKSVAAADVSVADKAAATASLENVNSPVKAGLEANGSVLKEGEKDAAVLGEGKASQDEPAPPTPQTLDKRGPVVARGRATRGAGSRSKAVAVLLAF